MSGENSQKEGERRRVIVRRLHYYMKQRNQAVLLLPGHYLIWKQIYMCKHKQTPLIVSYPLLLKNVCQLSWSIFEESNFTEDEEIIQAKETALNACLRQYNWAYFEKFNSSLFADRGSIQFTISREGGLNQIIYLNPRLLF